MKVLSAAAIALLAGSSDAFAPSASSKSITKRATTSSESNRQPICSSSTSTCLSNMFFAQETEEKEEETIDNAVIAEASADAAKAAAANAELNAMSIEEEVELLVEKELSKSKSMSNLRNAKGVEYAPWMGISEAEETSIRNLMREKTEARRKRQLQEQDVSGNLFRDSQAQELSGTGLSYKIINGEVELTWATKSESDTKGFIVKRRAAKTNDYSVIASYSDYGPLVSKGKEGGVYRFMDSSASPGGWVYRISEADSFGNEADVCQCLVEVETEDEQRGAVIAGVGFGVFAIAAFVAGVAFDPMNGY